MRKCLAHAQIVENRGNKSPVGHHNLHCLFKTTSYCYRFRETVRTTLISLDYSSRGTSQTAFFFFQNVEWQNDHHVSRLYLCFVVCNKLGSANTVFLLYFANRLTIQIQIKSKYTDFIISTANVPYEL